MKSSKAFPLRQSGIYRNLPTIDPSVTGLTAIVTGATGISGWNMIRCLLESPTRWSIIYALSRKPPSQALLNLLPLDQQARVKHVPVDLLSSPEEVAKSLKSANVTASHVFFYAYVQPKPKPGETIWSNAEGLVEVNEKLLATFLEALPIAQVQPERILLQTGGKNYGGHIGRTRLPCVESDPQPKHLEPNFYYNQEGTLFSYCANNPATGWNIIRPAGIIGASDSAQMNMMYVLAAYTVVQAHKGAPLFFPGGWENWQDAPTLSTARLTGYLSEWVILEEACMNQAFNAEDGNLLTWDRLFHELCRWYSVEKGIVGPTEDPEKPLRYEVKGGMGSPLGYGPSIFGNLSFSLRDWARDPANAEAWEEMTKRSNSRIVSNPFQDDPEEVFGMAELVFTMPNFTMGMNKARRLGWTGFVDTLESTYEALVEMGKLGLLPAIKVDGARPMI